MNETLISNYNALVHPTDTVYFLGDIFFCDREAAKVIMDRLHGTKILILGNHDMKPNDMYRIGFSAVLVNAQMKIGKTLFNLSHYPYKRTAWNHFWRKHFNKKYRSKLHFRKMYDDGNWLLHGHSHSKEKIVDKMIHVGVDAWNYKPIPITKISEMVDIKENK